MLANKKVLVKIISNLESHHVPGRSVGVAGSKSSIFCNFIENNLHQILSI
jgi:hypothetical protein